jgi:glycosyltransferase involved in cell wall biosynthesis
MKIVGGIITKNAEWFLKESIESYIDLVDKLIVVDDGSVDGTLDVVASFGKKVKIIQGNFKRDKAKQRQVYVDEANIGDFILCPDSDEVFTVDNLKLVEQTIASGDYLTIAIQHLNFWKKYNTIIVGEVWDQFMQRGFKKLKNTGYYALHHSVSIDSLNYFKFAQIKNMAFAYRDKLRVHHYGYMKPEEQVYNKIAYYMRRDNPNCRRADGSIDERLIKEYTNKHPFFSNEFTHPRYGTGGLFCCGVVGNRTDKVITFSNPHPVQVAKRLDYKVRGGV